MTNPQASSKLHPAMQKAIDDLSEKVDIKLRSIMAGNLSILVDSYRGQINRVFELYEAEQYRELISLPSEEENNKFINDMLLQMQVVMDRELALIDVVKFYADAFELKITDSGMGQFTPFLVDRGARAKAALAKYEVTLNAEDNS